MNESVKRMKSSVLKLTCATMLMTMCTGYGAVFADESENKTKTDLIEMSKSAEENVRSVTLKMMDELKEANLELDEKIRLIEGFDGSNSFLDDLTDLMEGKIAAYVVRDTQTGTDGVNRRMLKIYVHSKAHEDKNVQIWAVKGGKHILIKDYGINLARANEWWGAYIWNQDDVCVVKDNIFKRNDESTLREYAEDMEDIGIYIKKRRGKEVATYYKKVSNLEDRSKKDAYLITSYDTNLIENERMSIMNAKGSYSVEALQKLNSAYSTEFPAVAQVGIDFQMCMIKEWSGCTNNKDYHYDIYVEGDNGYKKTVAEKKNGFTDEIYTWVPDIDGIFNIVVKESETGEIISVRKVFVRKADGGSGYLGITSMDVSGDNGAVNVNVGVENFNNGNNRSQVALKVGEESVWSKHLKEFDGEVNDNVHLNGDKFTFNSSNSDSGNIPFKLGSGEYLFTSMVKNKSSIEYEDMAARYFSEKEYEELFKLKVSNVKLNESEVPDEFKKLRDDQYYKSDIKSKPIERKERKCTFRLIPKNKGLDISKYRFSFLLWDAKGKRVIVKESESPNFEYYFRDPGKYKVYFRVKEADVISLENNEEDDRTLKLQNSYFEEHTEEIEVQMAGKNRIEIESVKVENYKVNTNTDEFFTEEYSSETTDEEKELKLKSHSKNLIYINAHYYNERNDSYNANRIWSFIKSPAKEGRLMYKVYAIHDGVWECLTPYTASAVIPFYPRSTGDYKLLVLVKDSISGSEEAKMYIDAKAED